MIKVSIIIPVFNKEKYLEKCLKSVLDQTLEEKEIICIDDGSQDLSCKILEKYETEIENFKLVKQENKGAGAARNLGIGIAKGEYICFIDADDYYAHNDALEHMYLAAKTNTADISGGGLVFDFNGRWKRCKKWVSTHFEEDQVIDYMNFQEAYYHVKYIYSNKLLKENNIRYPEHRIYEDPPFLAKAMMYAKSFYALEETVYVYRVSEKERTYSVEDIREWLKGIRDVLEIAVSNGLKELTEFCINEINIYNKHYIYWGIYQEDPEIMEILQDMSKIARKIVVDWYEAADYIETCFNAREKLLLKCKKYENIIIYGAGVIGKKIGTFLHLQGIENIEGYAITGEVLEPKIGQYFVKNIDEYLELRNSALVLVAIKNQKYKKEIKDTLRTLQFLNIYFMEEEIFRIPSDFIMEKTKCYYSDNKENEKI